MPISHRSIIHDPIDYTAPVDLNLLGRVLQFKQAQYDAGAKQFQGHVDNLASMDVVRGVDKDYLNGKINNLVSTVNNMGGLDFSDSNVANQISGLSSQVYGDDNIISAVANTKKFRYVQKYYQDLKEKKPKEYNAANEDYDFSKFEKWLSSTEVGGSPEGGAGQVTPYTAYRDNHAKLFEKIAGNMRTEWTEKGLMYRKDEIHEFTEAEVASAAAKLLSPQERMQMSIDARYQFKHVPEESVVSSYAASVANRVGELSQRIETYNARLKGALSVQDQEAYKKAIAATEAEIERTKSSAAGRSVSQMKEDLFYENYFKGLGERFAFSKVKSTMQANTGEMFRQRQNLAIKEFEYKQRKEGLDQRIEMAKEGLMYDPLTQQVVPDPSSPVWTSKKGGKSGSGTGTDGDWGPMLGMDNANSEQQNEFSKTNLDQKKVDISKANEQLRLEYIKKFARLKGIPDATVSQYLEGGHITTKISPEHEKVLKDKMATWEAMTRGEKVNYKDLDPLFKEFAGKYQANLKQIEGIDNFYNTINRTVAESYGVTDADIQNVKTYQQLQKQLLALDSKYPVQTSTTSYGIGGGSTTSTRLNKKAYDAEAAPILQQIAALKPHLQANHVQAYMNEKDSKFNELVGSATVKFNMPTMTISDDSDKNLAKMISGNAAGMHWYNDKGEVGKRMPLNPDNIQPISKGYGMVKNDKGEWVKQPIITFKYKTKSGTDEDAWEVRKVQVTPEQQIKLGFGSEIKDLDGYRLALHLNNEVRGIYTTSGKTYDLKYDVVKDDEGRNDDAVFVRVWKGDTPIVIHQALGGVSFQSIEHAQAFMEQLTKFKDIDEAFTLLTKLSRGEK